MQVLDFQLFVDVKPSGSLYWIRAMEAVIFYALLTQLRIPPWEIVAFLVVNIDQDAGAT